MGTIFLIPAESVARLLREKAESAAALVEVVFDEGRIVGACEKGIPAVRDELATSSRALREKVQAAWTITSEELAGLGCVSFTPT